MSKHKNQELVRGKIFTTGRGVAFVLPLSSTDKDDEYRIPEGKLHGAWHGDIVDIKPLGKKDWGKPLAKVVEIVEAGNRKFVATTILDNGDLILKIDDSHAYTPARLKKSDLEKVKLGQKVLIVIEYWDNLKSLPAAKLLRVLGKAGEHETEIQAILAKQSIDTTFPPEVVEEARDLEKNHKTITPQEFTKRRDMRSVDTFTIDPADAKDFDDAISLGKLPNGNFEIGVHIADVSHFVRPGTALDKEAFERSFSVYLVDRTIPMLPEELSNDLCSLNPQEDKRAFSIIMEVDSQGKVKKKWLGETIIHSNHRFSYEDAQAILDGKHKSPYADQLHTLNKIAKHLEKEKFKNGAISFDTHEVRFVLDKDNKPVKILIKKRLDTHKLVEEFMLLANREVAKTMTEKQTNRNIKNGFVYRIHGEPDMERLENLANLVHSLGYKLTLTANGISSEELNKLFAAVSGKPEEALIKTAAVRTMAKAIYSSNNIGHYGLAFDFYTHFTSPIRRYPDLLVHRLVKKELAGEKPSAEEIAFHHQAMLHAGEQEKAAVSAERESIKFKQVEYMSVRIGEEFLATITGVTEWGVYAQTDDTKTEGMVRLRDLPGNDFYQLDPKTYSVVGQKKGRRFQLGDAVQVKITGTDLEKKTIDMKIV